MSSKISLKSILHPKTSAGTWARDIVSILLCVALIGTILFSITGIWPRLVAVESGSMEPNIPTYSLVFVSDEERFGGWQTQEEALNSSSDMKFNEYGDVIVYRPNGITGVTPIIHRAITHVTAEEAETLLNFTGEAAHAGYITKGDNEKTNPAPDQEGIFKNYGRMQPVKPEWIVGKAVFAIPFVGWIPLIGMFAFFPMPVS